MIGGCSAASSGLIPIISAMDSPGLDLIAPWQAEAARHDKSLIPSAMDSAFSNDNTNPIGSTRISR